MVAFVEALTESGKTLGALSREFFREEYTLNYLTSKFLHEHMLLIVMFVALFTYKACANHCVQL